MVSANAERLGPNDMIALTFRYLTNPNVRNWFQARRRPAHFQGVACLKDLLGSRVDRQGDCQGDGSGPLKAYRVMDEAGPNRSYAPVSALVWRSFLDSGDPS